VKRNPKSPWNPNIPVDLTPEEYENQVVSWLRDASGELESFTVEHSKKLQGSGGEYEFDAVAEFRILNGALIKILIECKRYKNPVKRDLVLTLWAKLQDIKAHKAMMFSTSGFQRGAIEFASKYNIATVTFVEGKFLYETRAFGQDREPPSWVDVPKYAGLIISMDDQSITSTTIYNSRVENLSQWLNQDSGV